MTWLSQTVIENLFQLCQHSHSVPSGPRLHRAPCPHTRLFHHWTLIFIVSPTLRMDLVFYTSCQPLCERKCLHVYAYPLMCLGVHVYTIPMDQLSTIPNPTPHLGCPAQPQYSLLWVWVCLSVLPTRAWPAMTAALHYFGEHSSEPRWGFWSSGSRQGPSAH